VVDYLKDTETERYTKSCSRG